MRTKPVLLGMLGIFMLLISSPAINSAAMDFIKANSSVQAISGDSHSSCQVHFFGCGYIFLPEGSFTLKAAGTGARTYPTGQIPVLSGAASIKGALISFPGDNLSRIAPGSNITVCIYPLSPIRYLFGDSLGGLNEREECIWARAEWNRSEMADASGSIILFNISENQVSERRGGLYAVCALDENRSLIFPPEPFLLTDGEAILQTADKVRATETLIGINLSSKEGGNQNKIFAAVMMPRKDYNNITIGGVVNESTKERGLIIYQGSESIETRAGIISQEWIMDMLPLLPEDSAVSVQESAGTGVDLILLADGPWEKGEYVILSAIYSPADGLIGLKQKIIYVVPDAIV